MASIVNLIGFRIGNPTVKYSIKTCYFQMNYCAGSIHPRACQQRLVLIAKNAGRQKKERLEGALVHYVRLGFRPGSRLDPGA